MHVPTTSFELEEILQMRNQVHPCFIFNLQQDIWQLSRGLARLVSWWLDACWDGLHTQVVLNCRQNLLTYLSCSFKVNLNTLCMKGNEKWAFLLYHGAGTSWVFIPLTTAPELPFFFYSQLCLSATIRAVHWREVLNCNTTIRSDKSGFSFLTLTLPMLETQSLPFSKQIWCNLYILKFILCIIYRSMYKGQRKQFY